MCLKSELKYKSQTSEIPTVWKLNSEEFEFQILTVWKTCVLIDIPELVKLRNFWQEKECQLHHRQLTSEVVVVVVEEEVAGAELMEEEVVVPQTGVEVEGEVDHLK